MTGDQIPAAFITNQRPFKSFHYDPGQKQGKSLAQKRM